MARNQPSTDEDAGPEPNPTNISSPIDPLLLTVTEAAAMLGIGRTTMYELLASDEVESVHIGRAIRIPVDSLRRYVATLRQSVAS